MNFDASYNDNKVSTGGVFQDVNGNAVLAYTDTTLITNGGALIAEAKALEAGLAISKDHNIEVTEVKGDYADSEGSEWLLCQLVD